MGLNRQPKSKNHQSRYGNRHNAYKQRQKAGTLAEPASFLPKEARDMLVDVLHHVATGGAIALEEKHFDPNNGRTVITFKKNTKMSDVEVAQLVFEKLGFPPNAVAQFLVEMLNDGQFPSGITSVIDAVGSSSPHGKWFADCCWDLFAIMLWHSDGDAAGDDAAADEDAPDMSDEIEAEREQIEMIFGDFYAGEKESEQHGETFTDRIYNFPSSDDVNVTVIVRIDEFYPEEPPLIYLDIKGKKGPTPATPAASQSVNASASTSANSRAGKGGKGGKGGKDAPLTSIASPTTPAPSASSLASSAVALTGADGRITADSFAIKPTDRRAIMDAAVEALQTLKGQCVLTLLLSSVQSAIAGLALKAPAVAEIKPSAAAPTISAAQKEKEAKKADFLKGLKSGTLDQEEYKLPTKVELQTADTQAVSDSIAVKNNRSQGSRTRRNPALDEELKKAWEKLKKEGPLSGTRQGLPAALTREELRAALNSHNVVVVSGETGSGKTTQVPQYLFEFMCEEGKGSMCNVVCTQPRRLAATAVALRVADERNETIGDTVGYSIRMENKISAKTRIMFCTTGIVLRRLQTDAMLEGVSHVVVDEIHERGVDTDFLLILLRDLLERRKDLKVVLMSATMNAELFSRYFNGAPLVGIGGRTFPVTTIPLEKIIPQVNYVIDDGSPYAVDLRDRRKGKMRDPRQGNRHITELGRQMLDAADERKEMELAEQFYEIADTRTAGTLSRMNLDIVNYELVGYLVADICKRHKGEEGAILIFMPGLAEIHRCMDELKSDTTLRDKCVFFNLHSSLGSTEQRDVFKKPPRGMRKVIIGTNIMETSITIDDAVFVIDSGKVKENRYDPKRSLSQLVTCWVSKANVRQRAGRAGRVRPGFCYQLYTSLQFDEFEDHQLCEMHRVPLESLILQIYTLNLGDEVDFLSKALSPPERKAIEASVKSLTGMGALTYDKRLTSLGLHLSNLPIDVHIGKMMIHGALMMCLDPVLTMAACLSVRSPFMASVEHQNQISAIQRAFAHDYRSDQLANWFAYQQWAAILIAPQAEGGGRAAAEAFCRKNFLSSHTLYQIQSTKQQYEYYLYEGGFLEGAAVEGADRRRRSGRFLFEPYRTLDEKVAFEAGGYQFNVNSENIKCITACVVAGLYPNVAKVQKQKTNRGEHVLSTLDGSNVEIHPSSVASKAVLRYPLVCYVDKIKTSSIFLREVTMVTPFQLILFGGSSMKYLPDYQEMVVDNMIAFACTQEDATLLQHIKDGFAAALTTKINTPTSSWESVAQTVVRTILKLLKDEMTIAKSMIVVERGERKPLTANLASASSNAAAAIAAKKAALPEPPSSQPFKTGKSCFNCGAVGHVTKYCPDPQPPKERGAATVRCFICGQWHHPAVCDVPMKQ